MHSLSPLERALTSPVGRAVARRAGLPDPPPLRRGRTAPNGPIALAAPAGGSIAAATLRLLGLPSVDAVLDLPERRVPGDPGEHPPAYPVRPGALVIDAMNLRRISQLNELRRVLRPVMRALQPSGRIVLLAAEAAAVDGLEATAVAQAIDGLTRTVAKELRGGSTANLICVGEGATAPDLVSTLRFLLEGRSAYVNGQAWRVGPRLPGDADTPGADPARPLAGRIVAVTGAARGIGAAIARTVARDGAIVVAVDLPGAGEALTRVANEVRGSALQLDITASGAGRRVAAHTAATHGADARLWAMVHNAGITRDKLLANLDERRWAAVLEVNLAAQLRINEALLDPALPGGLAEQARIVAVASTSGIAGNKGQANYAAAKAGVIGLVRAQAEALADLPITVNAVAPGFIETDMTAAIPYLQREVFRRASSLAQGGLPVDVAETIAYLCDPASGGVNGQVIRVCGQNLVGA